MIVNYSLFCSSLSLLSFASIIQASGQNKSEARPNMLIIMADQLNPGVLSCYGGKVPTPNIDRLAREGAMFINSICTYPVSSPSRASMITGQYVHKHGIIHNCMKIDYPMVSSPSTEECIVNADITAEKILNTAGYNTHHYGKWHLTQETPSYYPDMYGEHLQYAKEMKYVFDSVINTSSDQKMNWYNWQLPVEISDEINGIRDSLKNLWGKEFPYSDFVTKIGRLKFSSDQLFDYQVARRTSEFILNNQEKSFMVTCSFNMPHDPNVIQNPYYDLFDPDEIKLPENFDAIEPYFNNNWSRKMIKDMGEPALREFMRIYYGSVKFLDDQVGLILEALRRSDQIRNTVIVFTSDHGDMCGSHGMFWKSTTSFYNEVVKVPLVIWLPEKIKPARYTLPVSLVDLMPTLLDIAHQSIPSSCQGTNLLPLLTGEENENKYPQFVFCERLSPNPGNIRKMEPGNKGAYMVMSKSGKYIEYEDGKRFFYDLNNDPGETTNQIINSEYQGEISVFTQELKRWLQSTK